MRSAAGFVPDLMDRSRVTSAVPSITMVRSPEELVETEADVIILDLARPGALDVLPKLAGRRTIGFASHVDADLIAAASAAGCQEVLPRSRFFARLSDLGAELRAD